MYEMYSSGNSHKERSACLCMCESVCASVYVCVRQRSGPCCKGLRYPLLLSVAAMGLVVPGGPRWHRNPQSGSEKVTQHTRDASPRRHSLLPLTDSSGPSPPGVSVPHQSSESSTITFFLDCVGNASKKCQDQSAGVTEPVVKG